MVITNTRELNCNQLLPSSVSTGSYPVSVSSNVIASGVRSPPSAAFISKSHISDQRTLICVTMNPKTQTYNQLKMNERELAAGVAGTKNSWHQQYKDSAWVFLGGLPYEMTEGDIICMFSQYGEVVHINLIRDHTSGKSRGFGFLCYMDQRSTVLAVDNLNGVKVLRQLIRVDHVHTYKLPKDLEKLDQDKKKLFMEGCAPKPISGDEESSEEDDLVQMEELPFKAKKEKKKKKDKKHKKKKKRSERSESEEDENDDRQEKHQRRKGSEERGKADSRVSARDFFRQEKTEEKNGDKRRERSLDRREKSPERRRSRDRRRSRERRRSSSPSPRRERSRDRRRRSRS